MKKHVLKSILLGTALVITPAASFIAPVDAVAQSAKKTDIAYYDAMVLVKNGKDREAAQAFRQLAEAGDVDAMINWAITLDNGNGVPKDVNAAARWYMKAANAGLAEGQYNIGDMYRVGAGLPKDEAKARQYFEMAAKQGHFKAMNSLGLMYLNGAGGAKDTDIAAKWIFRAAGNNHPYSANLVAQTMDGATSEHYYKRAALGGNAGAKAVAQSKGWTLKAEPMTQAFKAYNQGDYASALSLAQAGDARGNPYAQNLLGAMYFFGNGVAQSDAQAFAYFEKAAGHHDIEAAAGAQGNLADMYSQGRGTAKDLTKAFEWQMRAAHSGDEDAMVTIAGM